MDFSKLALRILLNKERLARLVNAEMAILKNSGCFAPEGWRFEESEDVVRNGLNDKVYESDLSYRLGNQPEADKHLAYCLDYRSKRFESMWVRLELYYTYNGDDKSHPLKLDRAGARHLNRFITVERDPTTGTFQVDSYFNRFERDERLKMDSQELVGKKKLYKKIVRTGTSSEENGISQKQKGRGNGRHS